MFSFDKEEGIQRIVYFVVNTDDHFNENADAYRAQIETYLASVWNADVEVVLDIKSVFSSVQVTTHSGKGQL